jgi:hypothetical protein
MYLGFNMGSDKEMESCEKFQQEHDKSMRTLVGNIRNSNSVTLWQHPLSSIDLSYGQWQNDKR